MPTLEAEPGVPVQITAVGPVSGKQPHEPLLREPLLRTTETAHPCPPRLLVYARERGDDVRVLGRVEVHEVAPRPRGQVVEVQSRPEVAGGLGARSRPAEEA